MFIESREHCCGFIRVFLVNWIDNVMNLLTKWSKGQGWLDRKLPSDQTIKPTVIFVIFLTYVCWCIFFCCQVEFVSLVLNRMLYKIPGIKFNLNDSWKGRWTMCSFCVASIILSRICPRGILCFFHVKYTRFVVEEMWFNILIHWFGIRMLSLTPMYLRMIECLTLWSRGSIHYNFPCDIFCGSVCWINS